MKDIKKIIPWITGIIFFIALYIIISFPSFPWSLEIIIYHYDVGTFFSKSLYLLSLALLLIIFFSIKALSKQSVYKNFLINNLLYTIAVLSFIIFIELSLLKIIFALLFSIILFISLENIYLFNAKSIKYQPYSLQNFSSYFNLISCFLLYSSFFGFMIFLQTPMWFLLLAVIVVTSLLIYQLMWVSSINSKKSRPYILLITLLVSEGFWALAFLPTSIYVNALLLSVVYYVVVGLTLNQLLGILNRSVVKRYVTIVSIIILTILLSAKWI